MSPMQEMERYTDNVKSTKTKKKQNKKKISRKNSKVRSEKLHFIRQVFAHMLQMIDAEFHRGNGADLVYIT